MALSQMLSKAESESGRGLPHRTTRLLRKRRRWYVFISLLVLLLLFGGFIMMNMWSSFGKRARGEQLYRIEKSPNYIDGRFRNRLPLREGDMLPVLKRWLFEKNDYLVPTRTVPTVKIPADILQTRSSDLYITWFGHSTILIELDGIRILTDPMFGDNAAPARFLGVKRFYPPPLSLDHLPDIDVVLLSHDHFDHLDEKSIRFLAGVVPQFISPLGVGAHLEYWGVSAENIVELDWWDRTEVGGIELVCTPARHFSGRSPFNRFNTLWAGWAILGSNQRIFFSGDSGMFPCFEEIGERLGPFDVTMMDTGAYNTAWTDVHMGPEQAVIAHQMVGGRLLLPVHWGTFRLSFHGWTEPVERVMVAADLAGVPLVIPRPGERFSPNSPPVVERWWPSIPWETVEETPIISSGMAMTVRETVFTPF